jgi:creatinine amidohydrolase
MFPDELEAAFAACPVAWFSYGLCEPHGPQNALGLDALKAHAICCRAAWAHGGVVAPPDYWHIHEQGGYGAWAAREVGEVPRTWLTAVPPWIHFRNVLYQIRAVDALGFKAAVLLTGHYGPNWMDLKTLIDVIQPHVGVRLHGLPDFEANVPGFASDGQSGGDHAGRVETSLLWALEPACVDVSRMPPAGTEPAPRWAMGPDAREASRRIGERMVEDEVRYLGARALSLLAAYDAARPTARLRTFADVERLWEEVARPAVERFFSMQDRWTVWSLNPDPPDDSVWRANWPVCRNW